MATLHCSPTRHLSRPDPGRAAEPFTDLMTTIYPVTAISTEEAIPFEPLLARVLESTRVFGWFPSLSAAQASILRDEGGMHECLYTHLVVEEVSTGIHGEAVAKVWYRWAGKRGWVSCKAPRWSKGVVNWSMG